MLRLSQNIPNSFSSNSILKSKLLPRSCTTSFLSTTSPLFIRNGSISKSPFCGVNGVLSTSSLFSNRKYSTEILKEQERLRNIGISAHIDSGKTTLTERILYYTGRIDKMHEVRGKDGVGATMDSMELERQKGITIKSAATYSTWKDNTFNIIDTPGHVDFTIEVERALRVLDGGVLVICGVSGVQSQTITVDRQMKRYNVPRVVFINKLDRMGANPERVITMLQEKLGLSVVPVQIPIGLEGQHAGVVDLFKMKSVRFEGSSGEDVIEEEIPAGLVEEAKTKREEMIMTIGEMDDEIMEKLMMDEEPTQEELIAALRRATIAQKAAPLLMGSAYKNKGVQSLLDAIVNFLPNPTEKTNIALDIDNNETQVELSNSPSDPLVALAFKVTDTKFGQLTYLRVYQGTISKGDVLHNVVTGKKVKVPRLIRMHSDQMEDITSAVSGEVCAMFGLDCSSDTTFTDGSVKLSMTSMYVPDPVISLALKSNDRGSQSTLSKALQRFQREDPTFRVHIDPESNETILSGMGELHIDVYVEMMRREYGLDLETGAPRVAFRECVTATAPLDYLHKKQSGGQGQYARIIGNIEPLDEYDYEELIKKGERNLFTDHVVGGTIPPTYIPAIRKGFEEVTKEGPLIGHPMQGVHLTVNDGAWHPVDSSELAFKLCTIAGVKQAFKEAKGTILEPLMNVEITIPTEFKAAVQGNLNKRKGFITTTEVSGDTVVMTAEVSLNNMFAYANDVRSLTQGKGQFSMEYLKHVPVSREMQERLIREYKESKGQKTVDNDQGGKKKKK